MRFVCVVLLVAVTLAAAPRIESNVIYGMYSGLALLMEVYYPENPNGYGVVFISGSGWHAPLEYNAEPLSKGSQGKLYAPRLTAAGYTVFSISHRAAPRFRYPAAVEDVQRAVRYVRYHATHYHLRPDRIGAVGGSSGGHLVLMLGLMDGKGDPQDADPVNRESAKVQCVVARAAPADLAAMARSGGGAIVSFIGMAAPSRETGGATETRIYREASPISYVTSDDPPMLLVHGDADETVPIAQSEKMESALRAAGVIVKFLRIPGGTHGPTFGNPANAPDYMGEMVNWLDQHLRQAK
jgi:acetyl esterase/lipase